MRSRKEEVKSLGVAQLEDGRAGSCTGKTLLLQLVGCTWHNAGHALRRVSPNPLENPLEVIITIVIVTPAVWMPSTSLGDIQGCAAGKQAQAVWLFSQSFNLMLCCPLCSLPAFQASNQCSSRLGRRDEPGPKMFHHFDDVA